MPYWLHYYGKPLSKSLDIIFIISLLWVKIYGTYVLFVVVAFWIYYSSIVFIIGAEIGKLYSDRKYAINKGEEMID